MKYSDEQRIQKILMYSKKLNDYIIQGKWHHKRKAYA